MIFRVCLFALISMPCLSVAIGKNSSQNVSETVFSLKANSSCEDCVPPVLSKGQKWVAMEKNLKRIISQATVKMVRYLDLEVMSQISPECSSSIMKITAGIKELKLWALRFLDTMGKIPDTILSGGFTALGDFDGCLDINVTENFQGQSCIIEIKPPWPEVAPFTGVIEDVPELRTQFSPDTLIGAIDSEFKPHYDRFLLRIAICSPSTCTKNDIKIMAEKVMETTNIAVGWNVQVPVCQVKEKVKIENWDDYTSLILMGSLILMVISGTLLDITMTRVEKTNETKKNLGIGIRILICFSIYHNTEKLLQQNKSSDAILIFNGMRVVSILWIILSHTYGYVPLPILQRAVIFRDIGANFAIQPILNGYPGVDTFFFIGGTLLMYSWMKSEQQKIPILLYIFRRYWRLTPAIAFIIAFQLLVYRFGSGPLWQMSLEFGITNCRKRWWTNMIYINNFFGYDESCMGWTWYVATDMQLYIVSLIVLLTIKKYPKFSLSTLTVLIITSIAAVIANQYIHNSFPMQLVNAPTLTDMYAFFKYNYIRPHLHAVVYFIGLAVGYALHHKSKILISRTVNIIGWCASFAAGISVVYTSYVWYNIDYRPSAIVSALCIISSRVIWSLALSWVTISCCTGNGGFITRLLSWSAFSPLAKLTYMAYLVHPIIMTAYYASSKVLMQSDQRTMVFLHFSFIMASFMAAYFMSMSFEAPFMQMEKIMFTEKKAPSKTSTDPVNHSEVDYEKNDLTIDHKFNNLSRNLKITE